MTETLRRTFGTDISNLPRKSPFSKKPRLISPSDAASPSKINFSLYKEKKSSSFVFSPPIQQEKLFSSNKLEKSWRIKPDFSPQTDGSPQNLSFSPKTPNSNIKTPRRNTSLTPKALQTPPTPTTIAPFAIESNFKYSTNFLMSFQQVT